MQKEINELSLKAEEKEKLFLKREEVYDEVLRALFPYVEFSKDALEEFIKLPPEKKRNALRELLKLSEKTKLESLTTLPDVYKLKFSGGRIYLKREGKKWKVVGVLGSEQDKEKARFIKALEDKL